MPMRTAEEIISSLKSALRPLICEAEVWDYEAKLDVRISDPDGEPILSYEALKVPPLRHDHGLSFLLGVLREDLEDKGYTLDGPRA
jgi:hypothetical protein